MKRLVSTLFCAAMLAGTATAALAQPWGDPYGGRQQDNARAAVQGGHVRPLGEIIGSIARRTPGSLIDAAGPINQGGRMVYRILWDANGRQIEYLVDARSGQILSANGN